MLMSKTTNTKLSLTVSEVKGNLLNFCFTKITLTVLWIQTAIKVAIAQPWIAYGKNKVEEGVWPRGRALDQTPKPT